MCVPKERVTDEKEFLRLAERRIHYTIEVTPDRWGREFEITLTATALMEEGILEYVENHLARSKEERDRIVNELQKKWSERGTPGRWYV